MAFDQQTIGTKHSVCTATIDLPVRLFLLKYTDSQSVLHTLIGQSNLLLEAPISHIQTYTYVLCTNRELTLCTESFILCSLTCCKNG